jgi:catechol 2,3-dioxygenase-like lactoylglutathione lyase family enzyme
MPTITHVLETALYVEDLERATAFYRDVMGLAVLAAGERLVALNAGRSTVLLLFLRGATLAGVTTKRGRIPPHDGRGPAHFALAIPAAELDEWESHLKTHGVAVESRVDWSAGGHSLYLRDPDGHSLELATPGVWATY